MEQDLPNNQNDIKRKKRSLFGVGLILSNASSTCKIPHSSTFTNPKFRYSDDDAQSESEIMHKLIFQGDESDVPPVNPQFPTRRLNLANFYSSVVSGGDRRTNERYISTIDMNENAMSGFPEMLRNDTYQHCYNQGFGLNSSGKNVSSVVRNELIVKSGETLKGRRKCRERALAQARERNGQKAPASQMSSTLSSSSSSWSFISTGEESDSQLSASHDQVQSVSTTVGFNQLNKELKDPGEALGQASIPLRNFIKTLPTVTSNNSKNVLSTNTDANNTGQTQKTKVDPKNDVGSSVMTTNGLHIILTQIDPELEAIVEETVALDNIVDIEGNKLNETWESEITFVLYVAKRFLRPPESSRCVGLLNIRCKKDEYLDALIENMADNDNLITEDRNHLDKDGYSVDITWLISPSQQTLCIP